jgi:hypothetical protein
MEMPTLINPVNDGSKRPIARNRILSARFTESEYIALETFAWSKSMTLADWTRDALIQEMANKASTNLESHIFTELVGIQMLLMDTLEPLLRGDKLAQEQVKILFRQVQTTKAAKAQELLAKRSQKQEK